MADTSGLPRPPGVCCSARWPRALTVAALRRAGAPCLLLGETADKLWDDRLARSLVRHVLEIDAADHGMFLPGRLAEYAAVLGQVITTVEEIPDHQVWPPGVGEDKIVCQNLIC